MLLPENVGALAPLLPEVVEGAHMDPLVARLTPEIQAVLIAAAPNVFEPISGSWGKRAWTNFDLIEANEETLRSALLAARTNTAPPALVS